MNLLINDQYSLFKKIGSGAFSSIYHGKNSLNGHEVAIKLEVVNAKHAQLEYEAKILKILQGGKGISKLHWYGQEGDFNIMIMDLLGPSLADLFLYCNSKFSLKTVLMLADQMISLVEYLHENNFIHRDIKPENFLIGREKQSDQIFMIDFGLAKKFRDPRTGLHIPFQDNQSLAGVARYISINTHLGIEQSRRDDLESLGYCFLYFLRGDLPWMGVQAANNKKKYDKIREIKIATPIEVLCQNFPSEFEIYLKYCKSLKFEERPDYTWLKRLFKNLFQKLEFEWNLSFDWAELSVQNELSGRFQTSTTQANIQQQEDKINGVLEFIIIQANNLPSMDMTNQSDPYCVYNIYDASKNSLKKRESMIAEDKKIRTTSAIDDNNNPVWNYKNKLSLTFEKSKINDYKFLAQVYDKDNIGRDFIGEVEIPLNTFINKPNKSHKKCFELVDKKGQMLSDATIEIEFKFTLN